MPYIFAQAIKTSVVGVPMTRAMVIDYAKDPACLYLDRQYMFGDNLLVAPILNENGNGEYYLPEGTWTHILSGEEICGGRYIRDKHDYFSLPVLAKPNSIIAYGFFEKDFEYDYLEGTDFVIYSLEDGKSASAIIYDKNAEKIFELTAKRTGECIQISYTQTQHHFKVTISNGPSVEITDGANGNLIIEL